MENRIERGRRRTLAGEAVHPDAIPREKVVQRSVHRAEEGAMVRAVICIEEYGGRAIQPFIGPGIVCGKHLEQRFHDCPMRAVNQRISGKDRLRGSERTVFKKPATCGGKAIS